MSNDQPDDVYLIISCMDRNERRYVHLCSIHHKSKPDYLILFEIYCRMEVYNRAYLMKRVHKLGWSKKFMNKRNVLKEKILTAMRYYRSEKKKKAASQVRVNKTLENYDFYREKGLIDMAVKELQAAKKIAWEKDLYPSMLRINELERKLYSRYFQDKYPREKLEQLIAEKDQIMDLLNNYFRFVDIHDQLLQKFRHGLFDGNLPVIQEKFNAIDPPKENHGFPIWKYYLLSQGILAYVQKNWQAFHDCYRQLLGLYLEHGRNTGENYAEYCRVRSNFLESKVKLKQFDNDFEDRLLEMEKELDSKELGKEEREELVQCWLPYLVLFVYNNRLWLRAPRVIEQAEDHLSGLSENVNLSRVMMLKMNLALLLFASESWERVKGWLLEIMQEKRTQIRPNFVRVSTILYVIVSYELEDLDDFESKYRRIRRGDPLDNQKEILRHLRRISNLPDQRALRKEAFSELADQIVREWSQLEVSVPDDGLPELYYWAKSRSLGISLQVSMSDLPWPPLLPGPA